MSPLKNKLGILKKSVFKRLVLICRAWYLITVWWEGGRSVVFVEVVMDPSAERQDGGRLDGEGVD